jgi:hypothetical protein
MDSAQWQAGLGDYAYRVKGYKKIAVVGEDYSFVYMQVMGLTVGVLQGRRRDHQALLGSARHQGLRLGHLGAAR